MWVGRRVDRLGAAEPPGDNRGNGSAERRSEPTVDHACGICAPIRSCRALHRDCRGEDSPRGRSVCQSLVIGRRLSRPLIAPTVTERRRQLPLVRRVSADPAIPTRTTKPRSRSVLVGPARASLAQATFKRERPLLPINRRVHSWVSILPSTDAMLLGMQARHEHAAKASEFARTKADRRPPVLAGTFLLSAS